MPLTPGTRIGAYDVTGPLGAGGMGEVYRARDTKLDRDVALKVLPEAFTTDPDRLARFEREARVLASLNHPNIAQIHGLEETGGTRGAGPGAGRGSDPRRPPRAGPDPPRRGAVHRPADRPGVAGRARGGRDSPGSEAGQRQGARGRDRQGPGLRSGQGTGHDAGARRGSAAVADDHRLGDPDGRRPDHGNAGLHVARAGRGPADRHARRPLVVRRRALRDAVRGPSLLRGDGGAGAGPRDRSRSRPVGPAAIDTRARPAAAAPLPRARPAAADAGRRRSRQRPGSRGGFPPGGAAGSRGRHRRDARSTPSMADPHRVGGRRAGARRPRGHGGALDARALTGAVRRQAHPVHAADPDGARHDVRGLAGRLDAGLRRPRRPHPAVDGAPDGPA